MMTPSHMIIGTAIAGRKSSLHMWGALMGGLLPDVPMFLFAFYESAIMRYGHQQIWHHDYFLPAWQLFFDIPHALPVALLLYFIGRRMQSAFLRACAISMALHDICDFALHHDDGHAHLWPFTHFRFASPMSYWDPRHYGSLGATLEYGCILISLFLLWHYARRAWVRWGVIVPLALLQSATWGMHFFMKSR